MQKMKVTIALHHEHGHGSNKPREQRVVDIPTSWDQVTFRKFLELDKVGSDITKVIALLLDIEHATLLKAKIFDMDKVIAVLGFLNSPAQAFIPTSICGYPVPKDLAFEEVQQFVDLKAYLAETKGKTGIEQLSQYPVYCAVYACKHRYGSYDFKKAELLSELFFNAPCTEVLGIGNFTLLRLAGLNLNIAASSRPPLTLMQKFKLVLISWRKISVHMQRWFLWRKKLVGQTKNY
jgi:hypothetical protein